MTAKQIQKATTILPKIYALDKEIMQLDKRAQSIVDGSELPVTLSFEMPKDDVEQSEPSDDLSFSRVYFSMTGIGSHPIHQVSPKEHITSTLNDAEAIYLICGLINIKKTRRRLLVEQMQEIGAVI